MADLLSRWLSKEILKHPASVILLTLLSGGAIGFATNPFVLASEFKMFQQVTQSELGEVKDGICELKKSGDLNAIEQRITTVEAEVYQLERLEGQGEAQRRDLQRLDSQRIELKKLQRDYDDVKDRRCA